MEFLPVAVLAIIGFFTALITGIVLFFRTRHRERLALIKYDKEASIFSKDKNPKKSTLKWALLLMGAGAGILVGTIIDMIFGIEPGGTFASLLLFGGAGLFIYYSHLMRDKNEMDSDSEFI